MTDRNLLYDLLEIAIINKKVDWTAHSPKEEFEFIAKKIKDHLKEETMDDPEGEDGEG